MWVNFRKIQVYFLYFFCVLLIAQLFSFVIIPNDKFRGLSYIGKNCSSPSVPARDYHLCKVYNIRDECYTREYETIQKYGEEVWVINGIETPAHIRGDLSFTKYVKIFLPWKGPHILSKEFELVRHLLVRTYYVLHEYCKLNGIVETVLRGNCLAMTRDDRLFFPWDIEMDIGVRNISNFERMFLEAKPLGGYYSYLIKWSSNHPYVDIRETEILGVPMLILRKSNSELYYRFLVKVHPSDPWYPIVKNVHRKGMDLDLFQWNSLSPYELETKERCGVEVTTYKSKRAVRWIRAWYHVDPYKLPKKHPKYQKL